MAKRAEWTRRVAEWRSSGLTAGQFSVREGLSEGTLRHWAWRLAKEPRLAREPAPAFVEVVASAAVGVHPLEVVLRNDLRVRVASEFEESALLRLLTILESR